MTSSGLHMISEMIAYPRCDTFSLGHVFGNFSLALTIEFDLAGHRHKGPKECTNSIEEQFQLPKRSAGRMPGSGPRISHETVWQ